MRTIIPAAMAAAAVLATPVVAAPRDTPEAQLQKMLAGRVAGKPTRCIPLSAINSSEVISGKAIVYRAGSTLYVNEPRSGAQQLDQNDVLVTRTIGTQLCSIESVQLVDRSSRMPSGFVVLGDFVPYTKAKAAK